MPDTPATVLVRDLVKSYGNVRALRGVDFEVRPAEIFGLLGRNGAGKTTTLECVLGLRRPDSGSIRIGDVDARAQPERAKAMVGAQLQGATLQDRITPRQALRFFASFHGTESRSSELIERFGITACADVAFTTLSGGQRQRLFLALAFVHDPAVVVLDEPTSGLDPQIRRELRSLIAERRATGVTVLLSTHDLSEAEQLCDRVGILHDGRLVVTGSPEELIRRSARTPRLRVETRDPLDLSAVARMPGVAHCGSEGGTTRVDASDLNHVIAALGEHLTATANVLIDLRIDRPSLEDAFVDLTGGQWEGSR
ncbi:MAG TPA: ABC transporter ATP-binding protein [Opitutaceae bacterium]|nr:ABC transporter ATP-binding protein [Opitutaceae bacterium]